MSAALSIAGLCSPGVVTAQVATTVRSEWPVPSNYKSWSLFLVCNPLWLLKESSAELSALYDNFQAFGGALGPDHVAVWFWAREPDRGELQTAVDAVRMSAFCQAYHLDLASSPYVVVTTDYPGTGVVSEDAAQAFRPTDKYMAISLEGKPSSEITEELTELAQQIIDAETLDVLNLDPGATGFATAWQRMYSSFVVGLAHWGQTLRLKFKLGAFEANIGGP